MRGFKVHNPGLNSQVSQRIKHNIEKKRMSPFIETASFGHYPLFYKSWIKKYSLWLSSKDIVNKKNDLYFDVLGKINKHKSLERKRTVLISLPNDDLMYFMHEFFKAVEIELLEEKTGIH